MTAVPVRQHPLLLNYLSALASHPLRTKAITTGTLCFLQEVLGNTIAGVSVQKPVEDAPSFLHVLAALNIDLKALKMALYGFLVSAPLGHYLTSTLQKVFASKKGRSAKIGQILANILLISPIQTAVLLASMAVINGEKTVDDVIRAIKTGFFAVLRVSWAVSPLTLVIAQKFVPLHLWVPFFSVIQFVLGTFFNVRVKQRIAVIKKAEKDGKGKDQQGLS